MGTPDFNEQLGRRVRSLRESRKLSQETLAEQAGLSVKHLWKIEQGKVKASVQSLTKIAAAFGLPVHEVLDADHEQSLDALLAEINRLSPFLSLREAQIVYRVLKMFTGR
jgi:transcriptional regulator with XRE-family HTH domain